MGQYHIVVNLDKKEYLHGHQLNNDLKLLEQVGWDGATANGLFLLLACSNGRGGGDAQEHEMIGRWAGDKIAVIGDYAEPDDIPGMNAAEIHSKLEEEYTNISANVYDMMQKCLDL